MEPIPRPSRRLAAAAGRLEVYANFNDNSENFKYIKTKFYDDLTAKTETHKYRKVSIPDAERMAPKFRRRGIIFFWPQRKRISRYEGTRTTVAWFLSHLFYWLTAIGVFPTGRVLLGRQPPWTHVVPVRRPLTRDFIIEPDWESKGY